MSRNQFIENLRKSKYADLAKNSLRLVILEQHTEIEALERKLAEAREYMEEHDCLEDFNEWKNR